ncbi:hypothetical protein FH608_005485 [Nonomuraea phyllanthi]|uniref:Uncharacterized protein n=1 Tax=Nonomuraea phyllanthi TaxID=2219224 RepID=A0A5C4WRT0_9ACTN|nr:hypothetical protein [Nonomuraea phyllanthi]KAB8196229.1 hypothetical protein FH608_005485 [Nonomuraea phyllanthi]
MTSANDFLMAGGTTSAKFATPGTTVSGTICRQPEVQQQRDFTSGKPKTWDNGDPMMQLQVVLATDERDQEIPDDDGERAIYVKGAMKKAVQDAVRKSGAKGLEIGGTLTVTYTGDGTPSQRGMNAPKLYSAAYVPPAAKTANDVLNTPDPDQPAAPAAQNAAPNAEALAAAGLTPEQIAAILQNAK